MKRLLAAAVAAVLSVPLFAAPPATAAPEVSHNLVANGSFDPTFGLSGTGWRCDPEARLAVRAAPGAEFVQLLPLTDKYVPATVVAKSAAAQPTEAAAAQPTEAAAQPTEAAAQPTEAAPAAPGATSPTPRAVPATTRPGAEFVQSVQAGARPATLAPTVSPAPIVSPGPDPIPAATDSVALSPESAMNRFPHWRPAEGYDYQLEGAPSKLGRAECAQVVPVRASSTYTLTADVGGGPVFLGSDYGTTFTEPTRQRVTLTHTFVTGPTTEHVRIYVHGWYNGGRYQADNVVLNGPPSDRRVPEAPYRVHTDKKTSSSAVLSWAPSPGATSYEVLHNGVPVGTTTNPWTTLIGLTPGQEHTLQVLARNPAGASQPTGTVLLTRPSSAPPTALRIRVVAIDGNRVRMEMDGAASSDGYLVYVDGVVAGWSYAFRCSVHLTPGTHTLETVAFNTAGESPRSSYTITIPGR